MSKLSKFIGQSKEVVIRGETLKLFPLTISEMGPLDRLGELGKIENKSESEKQEVLDLGTGLIKSAYKEEKFTDEELSYMDLDLYTELFASMVENTYDMKDGKGINRIRELKEKAIQSGTKS